MKEHFEQLAAYNLWANARLYQAALSLTDADYQVRDVASLDEAALAGLHSYSTTKGKPFEQRRADILAHLFNHQTHHGGQAHAILSILTGAESRRHSTCSLSGAVCLHQTYEHSLSDRAIGEGPATLYKWRAL